MRRRFTIALLGATLLAGACQQHQQNTSGDKSADPKPVPAASPAAPATVTTSAARDPGAAPPPTQAPPANPELEAQAVALLQRMADIFAANAKDCDKLGSELKAFITDNRPALVQVNTMMKQQTAAEQRAFQTRFKTAQDAIGTTMHPGLVACSQNTGVQAALRDFPSN